MGRRRWFGVGAVAVAIALVACNAITGAHERFLDETQPEDAGKNKADRNQPPGDDDDVIQPSTDAGDTGTTSGGPKVEEIPINATSQWSTPNKAVSGFDGGAVITDYNDPKDNHPMLIPFPLPEVPGPEGHYTVRARIFANERAEYGIFARGHTIASGFGVFVLSSRYSKAEPVNQPFLAPLVTSRTDGQNDDPFQTGVANGSEYAFEVGHVWIFEFEVDDDKLHGTITREDDKTITSDMRLTDPTPRADRGGVFGFYAFGAPNAALIQLQLIH